jgi:hypothetical protein
MFQKFANIQVLAVAELADSDGSQYLSFRRTASLDKSGSYYQAEAGALDVPSMLRKVSAEYDISADPKDYLFEAIRAVTATVPNENADAFHKSELLRFDHRLGTAVYQTFILKPHHVNHRADNPKTARGVILDAHYNDLSPAMPECKKCGNKTTDAAGRDDKTGIECKKCGSVVKDEFVELLVAIDRKKDPAFARGVQAGVLNAGSMGCTCEQTRCSICSHVAHTKSEFCGHIRGGNKKKLHKCADGTQKLAFEFCEGVIFSEYSRVDQPADPTALQKEVFTASRAAKAASANVLEQESELLIMNARLNSLERKVTQPKVAGEPTSIKDYVEQNEQTKEHPAKLSAEEVGMIPTDQGAMPAELKNAKEATVAQNPSRLKFLEAYKDVSVGVTAAGNARVYTPKGTLFVIKPPTKLATKEEMVKFSKEILASIADHGLVKTMIDRKAMQGTKTAQLLEFHDDDMKPERAEGDAGPVTDDHDDDMKPPRIAPEKTVVTIEVSDRKDKAHDTKDLDDSVLEDRTVDFEDEVHTAPPTVLTPEDSDRRDKPHEQKKLSDTVLDGEIHDHKAPLTHAAVKEAQMAPPPSGGAGGAAPAPAPAAPGAPMMPTTSSVACTAHGKPHCDACMDKEGDDDDMVMDAPMDDAPPMDMPAIDIEPPMDDGGSKVTIVLEAGKPPVALTKEAAFENRIKKLYQARFAKLQEDSEKRIADAHANVFDFFARCMHLAAKRQALNLEQSPLKQAFGDVLLQPMDLDASSYFPGMDQHTAVSLIERAANDGFEPFVNSLLTRAADLMNKGEEFLKSAEEDVGHLTPVAPPVMEMAAAVEPEEPNEIAREAARGNMMLAPAPADRVVGGPDVTDKRASLRAALGRTRVNKVAQQLAR